MLSNIFTGLPSELPQELVQTLASGRHIRIERIVSHGHSSPPGFWYDQADHEWVLLLQGAARLQLEGTQPLEMIPGSHLTIPAYTRHRVDWTDPKQQTLWLAVYYT